ncbi:MAG: sigma-70 family RNA polymerase sigma factor [Oscillospiraceae bacterium]
MNSTETDKFTEENLGLVRLCANRFRGKGIEYDDLYSTGCIGLIKAVNGFDSSRGVKFSTYAVPVILGEIKRLFRDGGTVKVSRSVKELSLKITRIKEDFGQKYGREPQISELAELTGESEENIVEAVCAGRPVLSLTADDDESDGGQIDVAVEAYDEEMAETLSLHAALRTLPEKDQLLIYYRYYKDLTQTQTAEKLGMTQVQVSRREKKLLLSLRSFLEG